MRILWVTNIATSEIAKDAGFTKWYGGGWLEQLSKQLSKEHDLFFAFRHAKDKQVSGKVGNINYCSIPNIENENALNDPDNIETIKKLLQDYNPDIIHIWGTEYLHSTLVFNVAKELGMEKRVVVSLQGILSEYAKVYWGYIDDPIIKIPTLKEIIRNNSIQKEYEYFVYRSTYETELLKNVSNVIGRTNWDKNTVLSINPNLHYYYCNETMRPSFYNNEWKYDDCEKESLFVSQANYPIKGFHLMLDALHLLKEEYPNIKLYVSGKKPIDYSFSSIIRERRYDRYIRKLIDKYKLKDNVVFKGPLDEKAMCDVFLKSNIFISASVIENSSNAIAEAMLLGVPVIASSVGGTSDFIHHNETGLLYEANKPEELAKMIKELLKDKEKQLQFSKNEKELAEKLFDPENNYSEMIDIYKDIVSNK